MIGRFWLVCSWSVISPSPSHRRALLRSPDIIRVIFETSPVRWKWNDVSPKTACPWVTVFFFFTPSLVLYYYNRFDAKKPIAMPKNKIQATAQVLVCLWIECRKQRSSVRVSELYWLVVEVMCRREKKRTGHHWFSKTRNPTHVNLPRCCPKSWTRLKERMSINASVFCLTPRLPGPKNIASVLPRLLISHRCR